ncbi:class I SAM-dependent methyltransferase [Ectopseudomonas khazarica]|uniref:class I SAM-dependent methyltransferase n=1 Tax=Ectopseudomonas khazarica TaxID=2502979 RepID=UPI0037C9B01F
MNGFPDEVVLEEVGCPNGCQPQDHVLLIGRDRIHNIPGKFSICRCAECGLQRTNPRPTASTIGVYYPSDYQPYHVTAKKDVKSASKVKSFVFEVLGLRSKELPAIQPGKMLEIGCSSGAYMEEARDLGWAVDGVEFSEVAASSARAKGFSVLSGPIEEVDLPEQEYDIVTAWMVLEHLHDPLSSLRKLRRVVKPSGYLVASVPDASSLARYVFKERCYDLHLPAHLFHYTPKTISLILKKSGWSVVRIKWQRNSNTVINSFYYWAEEKGVLLAFAKWLKDSKSASYIRTAMSVILGATRLSGRIEIWAVPVRDVDELR